MSDRISCLDIPAASVGSWSVEHFEVSAEESRFDALRSAIKGSGRYCPPGRYVRLIHNSGWRETIMSDTPDEIRDLWPLGHNARGAVLLNGLGLGVAARLVLRKPDVTELIIVEKSADVIALTGRSLTDPRLTIINADAYEFVPPKGKRYGAVWHDIWDNICADNLAGMGRLHRKYGRRADWQGSWCRAQCERHR